MKTLQVQNVNGSIRFYENNKLHREDGPARETVEGYKSWHINGVLHREDGPAVIKEDGTHYWYVNGKLHRIDGPAIIKADGTKYWYIYGVRLTEQECILYNTGKSIQEAQLESDEIQYFINHKPCDETTYMQYIERLKTQ